MIPPWRKHPQIPLGSIGWRMGDGETYWREFDAWFKRKTPEHRRAYAERNPEPQGWSGFYQRKGVDPQV